MLRYSNIVVLTGAGLSAESGIATFRDKDGIWAQYDIEDVATPEAFRRNPVLVHGFYNERRRGLLGVEPNAAHRALARLEQTLTPLGGRVMIVTQNIDNLHEAAGTQGLIHMHGELLQAFCLLCDARTPWTSDLALATRCPACGKAHGMRPDVVWFGEMPYQMETIAEHLEAADLFVSIGTSGNVYPANGFVLVARRAGAHTVELNLEPSEGASYFHEAIHGPATRLVPAFVDRIVTAWS